MRKLLIFISVTASLGLTGCESLSEGASSVADVIPNALDKAPLIYRPTIQQGNVITQEQLNRLEPGMSKRQVRFVLGTVMLNDVFHLNQWDYVYTEGVGSTPEEIRRVTLLFEDDRLVRISGDQRPQPEAEREEVEKEILVDVPDWEPEPRSLWDRATGVFRDDSE